jgi:hypothetical protein
LNAFYDQYWLLSSRDLRGGFRWNVQLLPLPFCPTPFGMVRILTRSATDAALENRGPFEISGVRRRWSKIIKCTGSIGVVDEVAGQNMGHNGR